MAAWTKQNECMSAVETSRILGLPRALAAAYSNLGALSAAKDDRKGALDLWRKAHSVFEGLGSKADMDLVRSWMDSLEN
jgi:hypothetical protein